MLSEWFDAARLGAAEAIPRRRAAASRIRRERSAGRLPCRALTLQHWFVGMEAACGGPSSPSAQRSGLLCKDPQLKRLVLEGETAISGAFQGRLAPEALEALKQEAREMRRLFGIWTELDENHSSVLDFEEFVRSSRLAKALALLRESGDGSGKISSEDLGSSRELGSGGSSGRADRRFASETSRRSTQPPPSPGPIRRSGDLSRLGSRMMGLA